MSKATLLLLLVFLVVVADSILYIFMSSGIRITFLCTDKASNIIDYQTTPDQWTPPHNLYILEQQFLYITCGLLDVCSLQGWNAICDLASGEKAHFQSTGWGSVCCETIRHMLACISVQAHINHSLL